MEVLGISEQYELGSKLQTSNNRAGSIECENDTRDTIQQIKTIKILLQKYTANHSF